MIRGIQIYIIVCGILAVYLLGLYGFSVSECGSIACWPGQLQRTLGLFLRDTGNFPTNPSFALVLARYLAPWVVPFVALLTTIKLTISNLRHDFRVARARRKVDHVIVCGLGETGLQIVENFVEAKGVVAIDLLGDAPNVVTAERLGAAVLKGDATNLSVLRVAGLAKAHTVIICTGEDASNVDIALRIKQSLTAGNQHRERPVLILVELRSERLFGKLMDHDKKALGSATVEIRLFNTYESAARLMVQRLIPPALNTLSPFVIVGFGSMGRELAVHVLRAGLMSLDHAARLIVVEKDADSLEKKFSSTIAPIAGFAEVTFISDALEADTPESWHEIREIVRNSPPFAVAICLSQDQDSLTVGLEMRALLDRLGHFGVPVFVRLGRYQQLGQFVGEMEEQVGFPDRLSVLGTLQEVLGLDILVDARLDEIAKAYHEHWRKLVSEDCQRQSNYAPWPLLPEQYKMSSRRQADHIGVKLAQVGLSVAEGKPSEPFEFSRDETELLARLEHRRWTIERLMQGWQYGTKRDENARINPMLRDWHDLTDQGRDANRAAIAALPKILADANRQVRRR